MPLTRLKKLMATLIIAASMSYCRPAEAQKHAKPARPPQAERVTDHTY